MLLVDADWKAIHGLMSSHVSERPEPVTRPTKVSHCGFLLVAIIFVCAVTEGEQGGGACPIGGI